MSYIKIENLTKDYGDGRGLFDINLDIEKGETFGFVGTNGAGKTTTIRHLMGFLKPDKGTTTINGLDCWSESDKVKKLVGYIPGEIAFPDVPTGMAFLNRQGSMVEGYDKTIRDRILKELQLDATAGLKRMSKGMKQKTAITAAFMNNADILIMDEPTTGLDPLMRKAFVDLLHEEKKKGKTIFMSSHMFDEMEDTCDRVAMIKEGKILAIVKTDDIKYNKNKTFKIEFLTPEDYKRFLEQKIKISEKRDTQNQVFVMVHDNEIGSFIHLIKSFKVKFFSEIKVTLEEHFNQIYKTSEISQ